MSQFPTIPTQGQYTGTGYGGANPTSEPIGVYPQASWLYSHGGPQPYPFYTQAWFNPLQEQGYATSLMGAHGGIDQALQNQMLAHSLQGGFNQMLGMSGQQADPGYVNTIGGSFNPWNNPALDDYASRANETLARNFNQSVMPQITGDAVGMGQMGSSRHGIREGLAQQGLADAMQRQTADLYNRGFEQGMGRYVQDRGNTLDAWLGSGRNQLAGWAMSPQMYGMTSSANMGVPGMMSNLGGMQSTIGGYYQGMMNQYLQQQRDLWNQYQERPYRNLDWYAGIIGGQPGAQGAYSREASAETPWLPQLLGGGALLYGLGQENDWWGGGGGGGMGMGSPYLQQPTVGSDFLY